MPKRASTPPLEDGAKYLTVVYPYPSRPNMELENHRKLFAQWVAACIDPAYFRALYYKPSSPGSIIMEIDESLPDFTPILGAHHWAEILKDPDSNEIKQVSKVFYCTYHADRIVQKNGWKRIDAEDHWFTKHKLRARFMHPYPPTHWCDIPRIGNVIQNNLCRPLPNANFAPPLPPQPSPVVGTPEWQQWKREQEIPKVKVWTRDTPPDVYRASVQAASNSTATPSSTQGDAEVWQTPRQAGTTPSTLPILPPGLWPALTRANSNSSQSSNDRGVTSEQNPTPPLVSSRSGSSSSGDGLPLSPAERSLLEYDESEAVERRLSALAMDDSDDDDVYFSVSGDGQALSDEHSDGVGSPYVYSSQSGNAADDDSDLDDGEQGLAKAAEKKPGLCPVHNIICKKGICRFRAQQAREEKYRQRQEERLRFRDAADSKSNKGGKGGSKPSSGTSTPSGARNETERPGPPAHLRVGAPAPTSVRKQLPPHLMKGAAPGTVPKAASLISPVASVHSTPTPTLRGQDDDARSQSSSSSGRGGPLPNRASAWAPRSPTSAWGGNSISSAPASAPAAGPAPIQAASPTPAEAIGKAAPTPKAWGVWGRAPSISASSVQRNNESWSISAPEGDDNNEDADRARDDDGKSVGGRSVSASAATGWGTRGDVGPWGSTAAVRAAKPVPAATRNQGPRTKTWADEMDQADGGSVAANSTKSWGNISYGPW